MSKLESHPIYDHRPDRPPPPPAQAIASAPRAQPTPSASAQRPPHRDCPKDCPYSAHCNNDPQLPDYCPRPESRPGWGGRRAGAGAPKGSLNHFKTGSRSALIRRAVEVLAENKELRPFLLLIARAAVEGEIPQTTRRLILHSLGKTTTGMLAATSQLRRLRDES